MADFDPTPYLVSAGETSDANKFDNALLAIAASLNDIAEAQFATGKIFDPAKIKQSGATTGQALVWNGTDWTPGVSGPGDPVTTLPGTPVDKQQALLVDSLTAPTYAWLFQYESGISDANKWVFVGGAPASHEIDTAEFRNNTAYGDCSTVGPTLTLPRAGVYEVTYGFQSEDISQASNFWVAASLSNNGGAAADADFIRAGNLIVAAGGSINTQGGQPVRTRRVTMAGAAQVLKMVYKQQTASVAVGSVKNRWMKIVPVRVA